MINIVDLQQLESDTDDAPMPPEKSTLSVVC